MTGSDVVALLSERGVLEVAGSVVGRYHRGELTLDAAARRLATILRAARDWKVQHSQPLHRTLWIKALSEDQVTNPWSPMLELWSRTFTPRQPGCLTLWPSVPLRSALSDALHTFRQRWLRAFALYDEVARLMDEAA